MLRPGSLGTVGRLGGYCAAAGLNWPALWRGPQPGLPGAPLCAGFPGLAPFALFSGRLGGCGRLGRGGGRRRGPALAPRSLSWCSASWRSPGLWCSGGFRLVRFRPVSVPSRPPGLVPRRSRRWALCAPVRFAGLVRGPAAAAAGRGPPRRALRASPRPCLPRRGQRGASAAFWGRGPPARVFRRLRPPVGARCSVPASFSVLWACGLLPIPFPVSPPRWGRGKRGADLSAPAMVSGDTVRHVRSRAAAPVCFRGPHPALFFAFIRTAQKTGPE